MNRCILSAIVVTLASLAAQPVQAALTVFTDRAAWEAAVGSFTTEDFNAITTDTTFFNSQLEFDDLFLRSTGAFNRGVMVDVPSYQWVPGAADFDGSARVNLGGMYGSTVVTIDFKSPVSAFGFDILNYDGDNDHADIQINGQILGAFPNFNQQKGFFGVLGAPGEITAIEIIQGTGNSQPTTFNAFDNVSYVHAVTTSAVPEPTTAALSLLALAGLVMRRNRTA